MFLLVLDIDYMNKKKIMLNFQVIKKVKNNNNSLKKKK